MIKTGRILLNCEPFQLPFTSEGIRSGNEKAAVNYGLEDNILRTVDERLDSPFTSYAFWLTDFDQGT